MRKQTHLSLLPFVLLIPTLLFSACHPSSPVASEVQESAATSTVLPVLPTPTQVNPHDLLQTAVEKFIGASGFRMTTHEIVSYSGIAADSNVFPVYGEFDAVYDVLHSPITKVHIQSQFRFSPDSDFTGEEYFLFEQDGMPYRLSVDAEGTPVVEETGVQTIDALFGDVYLTVLEYGKQAEFSAQEADEMVYILDHPAWYTLEGAVSFADLGLLAMQPDGAELVKDYVEQVYPDLRTVRFILYVSITDQVITRVELDNRDFMLSFWSAYDQALIDQGADPDQLTHYEIMPEHGSEFIFSDYNQVPDFELPN